MRGYSPLILPWQGPAPAPALKRAYGLPTQSNKDPPVSNRPTVKLVREGRFVAEVDVTLIETDRGWTPYLSLDDAKKLDAVRLALRTGDLKTASTLARVYELTPVAAE